MSLDSHSLLTVHHCAWCVVIPQADLCTRLLTMGGTVGRQRGRIIFLLPSRAAEFFCDVNAVGLCVQTCLQIMNGGPMPAALVLRRNLHKVIV